MHTETDPRGNKVPKSKYIKYEPILTNLTRSE